MKWVNLHTHHPSDEQSIQLINQPLQHQFAPTADALYSLSLHPWDIEKINLSECLQQENQFLHHPQVIAIGECGLDRVISTPLATQEAIFSQQIELSEKASKPLIIHAVRTYPDLIRIKKNSSPRQAWILHGYQGNKQTTQQLLKHGFYFSFGPSLLKKSPKLIESLHTVPLEKLFFETDDSAEKVETIFIFAAQMLKISVDQLQQMVFENFHRIFRYG